MRSYGENIQMEVFENGCCIVASRFVPGFVLFMKKNNFFAFFVWMLFAKKTGGWVNIETKENVVPSKRHCTGVETSNSKCIKETIEASVGKSSIISNDCG